MPEPEEKKGTNLNQKFTDLQGWVARLAKVVEAQGKQIDLLLKHSKVPRSRG